MYNFFEIFKSSLKSSMKLNCWLTGSNIEMTIYECIKRTIMYVCKSF